MVWDVIAAAAVSTVAGGYASVKQREAAYAAAVMNAGMADAQAGMAAATASNIEMQKWMYGFQTIRPGMYGPLDSGRTQRYREAAKRRAQRMARKHWMAEAKPWFKRAGFVAAGWFAYIALMWTLNWEPYPVLH